MEEDDLEGEEKKERSGFLDEDEFAYLSEPAQIYDPAFVLPVLRQIFVIADRVDARKLLVRDFTLHTKNYLPLAVAKLAIDGDMTFDY